MPNLLHLMQMMRNWRIDGDYTRRVAPSTPIITVLPVVEDVEKIIIPEETVESSREAKDNLVTWWLSSLRSIKNKIGLQSASGSCSELQNMLSATERKGSSNMEKSPNDPGICLISQSPFRILRF